MSFYRAHNIITVIIGNERSCLLDFRSIIIILIIIVILLFCPTSPSFPGVNESGRGHLTNASACRFDVTFKCPSL